MKALLLIALVAIPAVLGSIQAFGKPSMNPPPLPYANWNSWAVLTKTTIPVHGNTTEDWSFGFHVSVVNNTVDGQAMCQFEMQQLYPTSPYYTQTVLRNYTGGWQKRVVQQDTGANTNCTTEDIPNKMPLGGDWFLTPGAEWMKKLEFLEYTKTNGENCSVYQYNDPQAGQLLQWYIAVGSNIPQVMINQTKDFKTGNQTIMTTAFNGYHGINALNTACAPQALTCGARDCVANPAASDSQMMGALGWVCGPGILPNGCANIEMGGANYYPNTDVSHATWAFNSYYQIHKAAGPSTCNFGGTAEMVGCGTTCTTCNASKTVKEEDLAAELERFCNSRTMQPEGCAPIRPGGENFFPNTTRAHADWAFNVYYQAYRCIPNTNPCDFNGTAAVVHCPHP